MPNLGVTHRVVHRCKKRMPSVVAFLQGKRSYCTSRRSIFIFATVIAFLQILFRLMLDLVIDVPLISIEQSGSAGDSGITDREILNNPEIAQDDPRLVALVKRMLIPPAAEPYNFSNPQLADATLNIDPSGGQSQAVKDILAGFGPNGIFIDCGANDGEWYTNTLWAERNLGWKGILIEADPRPFKELIRKNRKAYIGNFCLSTKPHPEIVPFYMDDWSSGIGSGLIQSNTYHSTTSVMVQCIPLYTVMLALGRTTIDFFSLDVEGNELDILRTLPDDVIFKVITIEHSVLKEGKLGLRKFMEERGYRFYRTVADANFVSGDSIFVHHSVKLTAEQRAIMGTDDDVYIRPSRN